MPSRATQAPWVNLVARTTTSTRPVKKAPKVLIARERIMRRRAAAVALGLQMAVPVPDHAGLAEREGDEDADDVELDQLGRVGVVDPDEQDGGAGEQHDAVGEGEPVAAGVQLARQVAVLREDRAEQREAVVRGVRGQEQDQRGGRGEHDEEEACRRRRRRRPPGRSPGPGRSSAPTGTPSLSRSCAGFSAIFTSVAMARPMMPQNMVTARPPMQGERGRGVLALRLAEGGHAVADRLDAGERRAAGGEGAQQQEDQGEAGQALRARA